MVALTMTSTQHIPAQALTPPTAELQYRIPDQPSLDGNTVDMDRERTQFADNSLQYQMSLSALSGQIKGMMNVLLAATFRRWDWAVNADPAISKIFSSAIR